MRTIMMILGLPAMLMVLVACGEQPEAPADAQQRQTTQNENTEDEGSTTVTTGDTYLLKVEGMMCTNCSASVTKTLEGMDGVIKADVNHETGEARVTMGKGKDFDEAGARDALDKDMFKLTESAKQPAAAN